MSLGTRSEAITASGFGLMILMMRNAFVYVLTSLMNFFGFEGGGHIDIIHFDFSHHRGGLGIIGLLECSSSLTAGAA
jgi:hypothetical protein